MIKAYFTWFFCFWMLTGIVAQEHPFLRNRDVYTQNNGSLELSPFGAQSSIHPLWSSAATSSIYFSGGLLYNLVAFRTFTLGTQFQLSPQNRLGFQINQFGDKNYLAHAIRLGYARDLGRRLSAGVQTSWLNTRTPEIGSVENLMLQIQLRYAMSDRWEATYLFSQLIDEMDLKQQNTFQQLGIGFKPIDLFSIFAGLDYSDQLRIMTGIRFRPVTDLWFSLAVQTDQTLSAGMGFIKKSYQIDASLRFDSTLGSSTMLGVQLRLGNGDRPTSE